MKSLALDIGKRRTGVAYGDSEADIVFSLETIHHQSIDELCSAVQKIASEKEVEVVLLGLPLLPSGDEGEQATYVRSVADKLSKMGIFYELLDERYTTPSTRGVDPDAASACEILSVWLDSK